MGQDAVLTKGAEGIYDFSLDSTGQIVVEDFLDTAILYSIFGEQRAEASEVPLPEKQRGWIGNEGEDFENGGKMWIYHQNRITLSVMNAIESTISNALLWLVEDDFAVSIGQPVVTATRTEVIINVTINRSNSPVINRSFVLWNNTGIR